MKGRELSAKIKNMLGKRRPCLSLSRERQDCRRPNCGAWRPRPLRDQIRPSERAVVTRSHRVIKITRLCYALALFLTPAGAATPNRDRHAGSVSALASGAPAAAVRGPAGSPGRGNPHIELARVSAA